MQHFQENLQSNSQRLGRDPQDGVLLIDDEIVIPHRSVDDLVKLLELPTRANLAVEQDPARNGPPAHPGTGQTQ